MTKMFEIESDLSRFELDLSLEIGSKSYGFAKSQCCCCW